MRFETSYQEARTPEPKLAQPGSNKENDRLAQYSPTAKPPTHGFNLADQYFAQARRNPAHARKQSAAGVSFFLQKDARLAPPGNNLSRRNDSESLSSGIIYGELPKKASKLQKFFRQTNQLAAPAKPRKEEGRVKRSFLSNELLERPAKNLSASPQAAKKAPPSAYLFEAPEPAEVRQLFELEARLFAVLRAVSREEDFAGPFSAYIDFAGGLDFAGALARLCAPKLAAGFKNALILERMGLIICFHLARRGLYEKELVFIKKIAVLAYSSLALLLRVLADDLPGPSGAVS